MTTKAKTWNNVPFKTWSYQKQTHMKHKVFGYYLPMWLNILGKWNGNLNYIDGFGGIGAYHTEEDVKKNEYISNYFGSPIISVKAINELRNQKKIRKANILVIDDSEENLDNIKTILEYICPNYEEKIDYVPGKFDDIINVFLDKVKNLAPTFFLLDPFGYSGIKLDTLKRIMNREKTEILLNLMYNSLQRWITHPDPKINRIYDEYFGGDEWRKCKDKHLLEKEESFTRIFRNKCKKFASFVYPFRLRFPNKNMTYYYLVHLTQHYLGCAKMKESFAKFNYGEVEYSGESCQKSLFDPLEKQQEAERFGENLVIRYKGQKLDYLQLISEWIDEVDLLESQIKQVLVSLEQRKKIIVEPFRGRKRTTGFEREDKISFL